MPGTKPAAVARCRPRVQTWMLCLSPIPAIRSLWGRAVAPGPACSPGGTGPCELLTCPSFIPAWHRHECWALPGPFVSRAQHPAARRDVPTPGSSPCRLHPLVNQHHRGMRRCWAHAEPETLRAVTPQCPGTPCQAGFPALCLETCPWGSFFSSPRAGTRRVCGAPSWGEKGQALSTRSPQELRANGGGLGGGPG